MIDPYILRTRHRQCRGHDRVRGLCCDAGQELRWRPRRELHHRRVLVYLRPWRVCEETCPVQGGYPGRRCPAEKVLRDCLSTRKSAAERLSVPICRLCRRQQLLKPPEQLEVVDLETLQDRIKHLLDPVDVADEFLIERPRPAQSVAMRPGRQVIRVALTCESEPQLTCQVAKRNSELTQYRPDLGPMP